MELDIPTVKAMYAHELLRAHPSVCKMVTEVQDADIVWTDTDYRDIRHVRWVCKCGVTHQEWLDSSRARTKLKQKLRPRSDQELMDACSVLVKNWTTSLHKTNDAKELDDMVDELRDRKFVMDISNDMSLSFTKKD